MASQHPPPPEPQTPPDNSTKGRRERRQYEAAMKRRRALELRLAGHTFEQIAQATGYKSRAAAKNAVQSSLRHIDREPTEKMRELELQRLDAVLTQLWPLIGKADLLAIDRFAKLARLRYELTGLLVHKVEHSGPDGGPIQYANLTNAELDALILAEAQKLVKPGDRELLNDLFRRAGFVAVAGEPGRAAGGEGAAGGDDAHAPDHA